MMLTNFLIKEANVNYWLKMLSSFVINRNNIKTRAKYNNFMKIVLVDFFIIQKIIIVGNGIFCLVNNNF